MFIDATLEEKSPPAANRRVENMARLARFERATLCLEGRCSIQLSYRRPAENMPTAQFMKLRKWGPGSVSYFFAI